MWNKGIYISTLICCMLLSGCQWGNKKAVSTEVGSLKNMRTFKKAYFKKHSKAEEDYGWLTSSGRIKIKSSNRNLSLSMSMKLRKDSIVWVRISKLIEVAQVQASKDELQLLNRLERKASTYDYKALAAYVNPDDGLASFEKLLWGKIPFDLADADFYYEKGYYVLSVSDKVDQKVWIDPQTLLVKSYEIITKDQNPSKAVVSYAAYSESDYGAMPSKISIEIEGQDLEFIELDLSKVSIMKKEKVKFEIPSSYKKD